MRALEARALLFQRKLQELLVDTSLPGLEELDGKLSVLELKGNEISQANKLAEAPDGTTESVLMQAAAIAKGLVMRDTKERVFSDGDVEGIAQFGATILKPLADLVAKASGLSPDALEAAKKNSSTTPVSDSSSLLLASSAEASPSQS